MVAGNMKTDLSYRCRNSDRQLGQGSNDRYVFNTWTTWSCV